MQHSGTDIISLGLCWGKEEQIASAHVPLMIGIALSQNSGILAFEGNLASYVQADGKNNMSYALTDWKPWPGLGPDSRDPVPEILVE